MCDSPLASPYLSLGANTLLPGATYVFFVAPVLQPDLAIVQVCHLIVSPFYPLLCVTLHGRIRLMDACADSGADE
jgi:hypothetical protein